MLKTFLKDNKISLARLTSPNRIIPFSNPSIPENIPKDERQKPISQPIIEMAPVKSPTGRRRKIFQKIPSPQSKITAEFGQVPNFSTVQAYPIRQETREKTPKRKNTMKTNKQNGLCLARVVSKDLQRQISTKTLQRVDPEAYESAMPNEHLQSFFNGESQRQKRVEQLQMYNRSLEDQLKDSRKKEEGSLIIFQAASDFTFQSDKNSIALPRQSLIYSKSHRESFQEQSINFTLGETILTSPFQMHR